MEKAETKSRNRLIGLVSLCAISCCLLAVNINVQAAQQGDTSTESKAEASNDAAQNQPWEPPVPQPDKFDWIQLISGEWLKGEIKVLYEQELEFDSDELGLQVFDWEDVKQILSPRLFSIRFEGPIIVNGNLQVNEDKIVVTAGEERQEFERSQLVAIASGAPKEMDRWSIKLSLGLNFASGNTEQTQYSSKGNAKRQTSKTRFVADYLGNFTETDGDTTINNQRLRSYFDYFMSRKYFLRPFFGEYFRDPLKNIDYRATLGAGMGYHILDTAKTTWDVSGGLAYEKTRFKKRGT